MINTFLEYIKIKTLKNLKNSKKLNFYIDKKESIESEKYLKC
ncbi:hypothetical protein CNEO2_990015 [Clostridium neonatale]|nr:hypothetical protein CNEO2_990015 [Clostridium neonatale]